MGGERQAQRTEDLFLGCIKLQLASRTPTRCLVPSAMASWERLQRKRKSAVTRDYKQKKKKNLLKQDPGQTTYGRVIPLTRSSSAC